MLRPDLISRERLLREIFLIEGHDNLRLGNNCGREDVSVVRIWQVKAAKQVHVPGDQTVRHGLIHQSAGAIESRGLDVRTRLLEVPRPFIVNFLRPARSEEPFHGQVKQEIPERRGV